MALNGFTLLAIATYATQLMAATPVPVTQKAAGQIKPAPVASGELVLYTAWDEGDINAVIAGFNKAYPNVKVSAVRSEGGRGAMLERMLTEIDSGKAMADVYKHGDPRHDSDASAQRDFILSLAKRIQRGTPLRV